MKKSTMIINRTPEYCSNCGEKLEVSELSKICKNCNTIWVSANTVIENMYTKEQGVEAMNQAARQTRLETLEEVYANLNSDGERQQFCIRLLKSSIPDFNEAIKLSK